MSAFDYHNCDFAFYDDKPLNAKQQITKTKPQFWADAQVKKDAASLDSLAFLARFRFHNERRDDPYVDLEKVWGFVWMSIRVCISNLTKTPLDQVEAIAGDGFWELHWDGNCERFDAGKLPKYPQFAPVSELAKAIQGECVRLVKRSERYRHQWVFKWPETKTYFQRFDKRVSKHIDDQLKGFRLRNQRRARELTRELCAA